MLVKEKLYALDDVTIIPAVISKVKSRKQCNPFYKIDDKDYFPIFVSPMECTINKKNFNIYDKNHIIPILPRTESYKDRVDYAINSKWAAFSLAEFEELFTQDKRTYKTSVKEVADNAEIGLCNGIHIRALIDNANGHMIKVSEAITKAKEQAAKNGYTIEIMAGNIANPKTYRELALAGADYIRCSIGTGNNCFVAGTKVALKDNNFKNIEDIQVGDYVLTHMHQYKKVTKVFSSEYTKNLINIKLYGRQENMESVTCTLNHPFYVYRNGEYQWVEAENLNLETDWVANLSFVRRPVALTINGELLEKRIGDYICTKIKELSTIRNQECTVYNIEVEDDHSYTANGCFVHNCTTASNTATYMPLASLIDECRKIKNMYGLKAAIIADGGISEYKNVIKALALGADYVMIGSRFTRCFESASEFDSISKPEKEYTYYTLSMLNNLRYSDKLSEQEKKTIIKTYSPKKRSWGMSTRRAQISISLAKGYEINEIQTKTSEGVEKIVDVDYTLAQWIENMNDFLRSNMSYCNAFTLHEYIGTPKVMLISDNAKNAVNK